MFRRIFSRKDQPQDQPTETGHFDSPDQGDQMIVEQLRQLGADLSQPREVLHYIYLPTESAASTARDELRKAGFTTEVRPAAGPPGPNPWLVLATIDEVVSVESARVAREKFTAFAQTHGGEYDGWEAAGTP